MPVRRLLSRWLRPEIARQVDRAAGGTARQLEDLRREVERLGRLADQAAEAANLAHQASQKATSARATAEAAIDGLASLEHQLDSLHTGAPPLDAGGCRVGGCTNKPRRRGFCGRHYRQHRDGALIGFVGPDGAVVFADGARYRVSTELEGRAAAHADGKVRVGGATVAAERV